MFYIFVASHLLRYYLKKCWRKCCKFQVLIRNLVLGWLFQKVKPLPRKYTRAFETCPFVVLATSSCSWKPSMISSSEWKAGSVSLNFGRLWICAMHCLVLLWCRSSSLWQCWRQSPHGPGSWPSWSSTFPPGLFSRFWAGWPAPTSSRASSYPPRSYSCFWASTHQEQG